MKTFLSHVLQTDTPLYGNSGSIHIHRVRSIACGDTSNNSELQFPAHSGTHIDAPRHFTAQGATLEEYPADFWQARQVALVDCPTRPGSLIELDPIRSTLQALPRETDCLLLRSGAEQWRTRDPHTFMTNGVGIGRELAWWIRENLRLRFLGMDCVSTSSFAHRETGREVHRILLGSDCAGSDPVLLIEDMALAHLQSTIHSLWVSPLRFTQADGAPVTVIADLEPVASS